MCENLFKARDYSFEVEDCEYGRSQYVNMLKYLRAIPYPVELIVVSDSVPKTGNVIFGDMENSSTPWLRFVLHLE